ncbi:MAG: hypothetical protein HKN22_08190 [Bacteroidia bacterium]|nr:hypothetical protein [Bacteroidia bacterium]
MRSLTIKNAVALSLSLVLMAACSAPKSDDTNNSPTILKKDHHSYSEPDKVVITNLHLDLDVDFENKILNGRADLNVNNHSGTDKLILDTRGLTIKSVTLEDGKATPFALGADDKHYGSPLTIDISSNTKKVSIEYSTDPKAPALQWLSPAQTRGGVHPFLFTQSQAILARSWLPCQDSPGVKFTYTATVKVPQGLLALMSAENSREKSADGIYKFKMPQPIPSYLMALSIGDLEYRSLGQTAGVYAEPDFVDACAYEFADVQEMINQSEELYGKYRWGQYDIIVLPPSFPFGGMENPRLTFATPTIIAGDRSLVALIAHELAHSWSGNLVTNATWDDFWLNEGFTVYFENRIMEKVYGREYSEMLEQLGLQDLLETIDELGTENDDTKLLLELKGRDPDEGLTDIAYEKGRFFLKTVETAVGREKFDAFLNKYFNEFAF